MADKEVKQEGLSRQTILDALTRLGQKLGEEGVVGEICIFGGTAMVLAFNARLSTKDVDAVFRPPEVFRKTAEEIACDIGLPSTWLNDGVKGFVSAAPEYTTDGLPQLPHLRVIRPTAEYLLAMKCMAARAPAYDTQGDREDIGFLIRHLGLRTSEEVFRVLERFYPSGRILPKTHFMILEVLETLPHSFTEPPPGITHLTGDPCIDQRSEPSPDEYDRL